MILRVLVLSTCFIFGAFLPSFAAENQNQLDAGFTLLSDGSAYHSGTGLRCPADLKQVARSATRQYNTNPMDTACSYHGKGDVTTFYLSDYDIPFDDYMKNANLAILYGGRQPQLDGKGGVKLYADHDPEASQACTLAGLLFIAAQSENQAPKKVVPFQAAVFKAQNKLTMVAITEANDMWLKLRYTLHDSSTSTSVDFCTKGIDSMMSIYSNVKNETNVK